MIVVRSLHLTVLRQLLSMARVFLMMFAAIHLAARCGSLFDEVCVLLFCSALITEHLLDERRIDLWNLKSSRRSLGTDLGSTDAPADLGANGKDMFSPPTA